MTALNFDDCIGCGLCVLGCPAYEETGFDVLTARGRNKALQAGLAAADMVEPIWACTLCGYCDAICPSSVHNVNIVLHLRRELAGTSRVGPGEAGTTETPGETVHKSVVLPESQKVVRVPFKVFRGMASIGAIRDRLDLEDADTPELEALGAEGLEVSVPARGSVRVVIQNMLKHLCSAVSYGGATNLAELKNLFWAQPERYVIRLSASGRKESFER